MLLHIEMEYACARLRPLPRIFGFIRMRYMLISDMRCADVFLLSKTTHLIMSHVDVTSSELREIHVCVDCDCDFTYAHTHANFCLFFLTTNGKLGIIIVVYCMWHGCATAESWIWSVARCERMFAHDWHTEQRQRVVLDVQSVNIFLLEFQFSRFRSRTNTFATRRPKLMRRAQMCSTSTSAAVKHTQSPTKTIERRELKRVRTKKADQQLLNTVHFVGHEFRKIKTTNRSMSSAMRAVWKEICLTYLLSVFMFIVRYYFTI